MYNGDSDERTAQAPSSLQQNAYSSNQ